MICVWKYPNFRYHGNRGWSDKNYTYRVKSADPETPIWRKNLDDISYTSWVLADFLIKLTNFCYHGNKGGSRENLNDSVWSANPPKPLVWCKKLGPILNVIWVIVILWFVCGNFQIFVTMATVVGLTQITLTQLNRQTLKTPYLAQESQWCLTHASWVIADFVIKFTNFCYHGNKGGSSKNLNDSGWSANPQNPQFGAKFWDLS